MSKKKRTAKQKAATKRMIAANKKQHSPTRKGHKTMAKKKSKKHGKKHHRKGHGKGFLGGGGSGVMADVPVMAAGAAIGFAEKSMKADATHLLNKLPTPIDQIGRTGNLTLMMYLASYFVPASFKRYLRLGAKVGAGITAYQLTRKGEAFKEGSEFFTIAGPGDDDGEWDDEHLMGDDDIGDVADEVGRHGRMTVDWDTDEHDEDAPHPADVHDEAAVPAGG